MVAATPLGEFKETNWPNFYLKGDYIFLDKTYVNIIPDSWIILQQEGKDSRLGIYRITESLKLIHSDFSLKSFVTCIKIESSDNQPLSQFDLRSCTVYLQSKSLQFYTPQTPSLALVHGDSFRLDSEDLKLQKGQFLSLTGQHPRAIILSALGGVYQVQKDDLDLIGLDGLSIHSLGIDANGSLIAATEGGVFTCQNQTWSLLGEALDQVFVVILDSKQNLLCGTSQGVYIYDHNHNQWKALGQLNQSALSLVSNSVGEYFCGTENGLFVYRNHQWLSLGLKNQRIQALVVTRGKLYAGTQEHGVYRYLAQDSIGRDSIQGLENWNIKSLVSTSLGQLFAGTDGGGMFYSDDNGTTWINRNTGLLDKFIQCLAVSSDDILYAGTQSNGVFYSNDRGKLWSSLPLGISNSVQSLILDKHNRLYAGTSTTAYFQTPPGQLRTAFQQQRLFAISTQLQRQLNQGLISNQLRKVFKQNNQILGAAMTVKVEHTDQLWRLQSRGENTFLIRNEQGKLWVELPLQLELTKTPMPYQEYQHLYDWHVISQGGTPINIVAKNGEIGYESASQTSNPIAEIVEVSDANQSTSGVTSVILSRPLQFIYDAQTLVICGNIVQATQGETIRNEVLGSGDSAKSHQTFTLQKSPLTFIPTSDGSKSVNTLTIKIRHGSNIAGSLNHLTADSSDFSTVWHEVQTFYQSQPNSRDYLLNISAKGKARVMFGDGKQGARLPSGNENVLATYRYGMGQNGNMGSGRLKNMLNRQPGIDTVTNPIPATGGTNPEDTQTTRHVAPRTIRTLGRIVSFNDYEDFAITFPGITKATARVLRDGTIKLIHLTIAATNGVDLSKDSELYQNLYQSIKQARAIPQPMQIDLFSPLFFQVKADIFVHKNSNFNEIESKILNALETKYSFSNQSFGQRIFTDSIIELMQDISGVEGVDLTAFYLRGEQPLLHTTLKANFAEYNSTLQKIIPAQLLLFPPSQGLVLNFVSKFNH